MKYLLSFTFTLLVSALFLSLTLNTAKAQVCLFIDPVITHEDGELEGMTTYLIRIELENPDDFVSAVAGNDVTPLILQSSQQIYQHPAGGATPCGVTEDAVSIFPNLAHDSWVTIGLSGAPSEPGEACPTLIESPVTPWIGSFEAGGAIVMEDPVGGAWFTTVDNTVGYAGTDGEVILAQLTTAGELSGTLPIQFFPGGNGVDAVLMLFEFTGVSPFEPTMVCMNEGESMDCALSVSIVGSWPDENSWVAEAGGFTSPSQVAWFNETGEWIGEGPVLDYVGPPATVCAVDMGCLSSMPVCIAFEAAPEECGVALSAEVISCDLFQVYADIELPPSGVVEWHADGALFYPSNATSFAIEVGEESVELCASIIDETVCPSGVSQCLTLEHPGCFGCPEANDVNLEVYPASPDPCLQTLSLNLTEPWQNDPVFSVDWDFGDGIEQAGNTPVNHFFDGPGVYTVCGWVQLLSCPDGFEFCQDIVIPEACETDCDVVNVLLSGGLGCTWTLEGLDGEYFAQGEVNSDVISFCLPEGCYGLGFEGAGSENMNAELTGASEPSIFEGPIADATGYYLTFSSTDGACEPLPSACGLNISAIDLGGGAWELSVNTAQELATINWEFNDGTTATGASIQIDFPSGSIPFACASAFAPSCDTWLSTCVDLESSFEGEALPCSTVEVYMTGMEPAQGWAGIDMEFTLVADAGNAVNGSMTADQRLEACLADGCYELSIELTEAYEQTLIQVDVEGNTYAAVQGQTSTLVLPVNSACSTLGIIDAPEAMNHQLFPNPLRNGQSLHVSVPAVLYDFAGRVIRQLDESPVGNLQLETGSYFVQWPDGECSRLVVVH